MKKLVSFLAAASLFFSAYAQVKIMKATKQKTFGGVGGVFVNYQVEFYGKPKNSLLEIDSVITLADSASIPFNFTRLEPCCKNILAFGYMLSAPKCKVCPESRQEPKQYNLAKGIVVYYRKKSKKGSFKVKDFKHLPDLMAP